MYKSRFGETVGFYVRSLVAQELTEMSKKRKMTFNELGREYLHRRFDHE
mgnify:FL=1|jgi:hypothetical protein